MVLGTYRAADIISLQSPLDALKQDLLVHQLFDEILLERLERADVSQYLAAKFAIGNFPAGFANLIWVERLRLSRQVSPMPKAVQSVHQDCPAGESEIARAARCDEAWPGSIKNRTNNKKHGICSQN